MVVDLGPFNPNAPKVDVSNALGVAGGEVTLAVTLENIPGVSSYGISMRYDPDVVTFVSAKPGDMLTELFSMPIIAPNVINFNSVNFAGAFETGSVLFTVTLKISEDVTPCVLSSDVLEFFYDSMDGFAINANGGTTPTLVLPRIDQPRITIPVVLYGDINGDGLVNRVDQVLMNQYFGYTLPVGTPFDMVAADINGDGKVDRADQVLFNQYFAGTYPGPLGPHIAPAFMSFSALSLNAVVSDSGLQVSGGSAVPGEEVTLTVMLENNLGLASYGVTMRYDPSKLTYVSATAGDMLADNFVVMRISDDEINFNSFNFIGAYESETVLFTVTFKVNEAVQAGVLGSDAVCFSYDSKCDGFAVSDATNGLMPKLICPVISQDVIIVESLTVSHSIKITGVSVGNGQADVDFAINSANGKGYTVYLSSSNAGEFKTYNNVNYNAKGAHLKGLTNGCTYYVYIEYKETNGNILVSNVVSITPNK
ncbi:MAG: dockerin type I domain-containing protein [Nitrososphaerota archaeon]|nr:dockerin type I domain-containing protein [Nitrososphaerota archaeon]